ncbi:hypothetical protein MUP38_08275 [Candidatus Bathyarchaeota archaeon]|nr:hypothetical protein [Candidatus Bathyarchaeota archaeon]
MEKVERSQLLALKEMGYGQSSYAIDSMHKREMAIRTKDLRLVNRSMAEQIVELMGGKLVDLTLDSATGWTIMMEPIKNLKIYYVLQRYSPEFEDEVIALYSKETFSVGIPLDDLYDFTRLCANALVRAARNSLSTTRAKQATVSLVVLTATKTKNMGLPKRSMGFKAEPYLLAS